MADLKTCVKTCGCGEQQLPDLYQLLEEINRTGYMGEEFERYFPKNEASRSYGDPMSSADEAQVQHLPDINDILKQPDETPASSLQQQNNLDSTYYHPSEYGCDVLNEQSQPNNNSYYYHNQGLMTPEPMKFQPCNTVGLNFDVRTNLKTESYYHWEVDKLPFRFSLRTRRTNRRKKGKLWQFLLDLLSSKETNPSIIKWEHKPLGIFSILDCDQVAAMWGKRKSNPSMTFEKLSRALRYYYELNILMKLDGHRLLYQFGDLSKA